MRNRNLSFPLLGLVLVGSWACGSDSGLDGGADAARDMAGGDAAATEGGATGDGSGTDGAAEAGGTGGASGAFVVQTLFANCSGPVMPDPITLTGMLAVTNHFSSMIGATPTGGTILDDRNQPLFTFAATGELLKIPAGATMTTMVTKTPDTLAPTVDGCNALPCDKTVFVDLTFHGPGVGAPQTTRSAAMEFTCAL